MLNIKKVNYDERFTSGCETCDYGSSYISEIEITLEDDTYANVKVDKMYEYALSESDYMKLIPNSETIDDFILNIIKLIEEKSYRKDISWEISLRNLWITKNGEDINLPKSLEENKIVIEGE